MAQAPGIHQAIRGPGVEAAHHAFAQTFNTTLTIPKLDIAPRAYYNFSTVVSAREPFTFIANMTSRSRSNHFAHFTNRYRNSTQLRAPTQLPAVARESNNNVSFLYVVGVEGAGNSEVSAAMAKIAQSCKYQVIYKPKPLWRAQTKSLPRTYFNTISAIAHSVYRDTNKVS